MRMKKRIGKMMKTALCLCLTAALLCSGMTVFAASYEENGLTYDECLGSDMGVRLIACSGIGETLTVPNADASTGETLLTQNG